MKLKLSGIVELLVIAVVGYYLIKNWGKLTAAAPHTDPVATNPPLTPSGWPGRGN